MATNLALDDALIEQARRARKHRTKKEAVSSAVREYVRRRRQHAILDLVGQIAFDEGYDHKPLRHRKRRPRSSSIHRSGRSRCVGGRTTSMRAKNVTCANG